MIDIAPDVERGIGPLVTARLRSGQVSFSSAECHVCGQDVYLDTEDAALSLLVVAGQEPLTLFSHSPQCAPSRVLGRDDLDLAAIPAGLARALNLQVQATVWNYMQIEVVRDDHAYAAPALGPGGLTRHQAREGILTVLDTAARRTPRAAQAAAIWRSASTEDLLHADQFLWCIYEYPAGQDPRAAALDFLRHQMTVLKQLGFEGDLPRTPSEWPE
ncbi:hypothetical protein [Streptomyces nanshensis]|uniref:Uncharacterized protein n=1 Tax=Streptomyces nanshensis TaxID=518642 RepID=A0A1E7KZ68_9ACTN|nr:hypothetical protein [Streptomyces nanshensis]OEV09219.1 hypothetical protein AN218_22350 [Streptomyces nanshensis]